MAGLQRTMIRQTVGNDGQLAENNDRSRAENNDRSRAENDDRYWAENNRRPEWIPLKSGSSSEKMTAGKMLNPSPFIKS
jgi:hypothetical protein